MHLWHQFEAAFRAHSRKHAATRIKTRQIFVSTAIKTCNERTGAHARRCANNAKRSWKITLPKTGMNNPAGGKPDGVLNQRRAREKGKTFSFHPTDAYFSIPASALPSRACLSTLGAHSLCLLLLYTARAFKCSLFTMRDNSDATPAETLRYFRL